MTKGVIVVLVLTLSLGTPHAETSDFDSLSLDPNTLAYCMSWRGKDPQGLVVFRVIDAETRVEMDSVEVRRKGLGLGFSVAYKHGQAMWERNRYTTLMFGRTGYRSVIVDSIPVPIDSAVIVTVRMSVGSDTVTVSRSGDSFVDFEVASLDPVFPRNEVIGRISNGPTGGSIVGASIYCEETKATETTDTSGAFVVGLGVLKSVNLNVWHPLYDSIRFTVNKDYIRTSKHIDVIFEGVRGTESGKPYNGQTDSSVLMLVDMMGWSSWGFRPREHTHQIRTYEVRPGSLFGPTDYWIYEDCLPFRFVKQLPNKAAWVQFTNHFSLVTDPRETLTNYAFLSDSAIQLSSNTVDAGVTITLSLQPNYAPRGRVPRRDHRSGWRGSHTKDKPDVDSCDIIKAEVERTHMKARIAWMEGDIDTFVSTVSDSFEPFDRKRRLPLREYFQRAWDEHPATYLGKRLLEDFTLVNGEISVYGTCGDPANEKFVKGCEKRSFSPLDGDVFIYWPGVGGARGLGTVYRKENGTWKAVLFI